MSARWFLVVFVLLFVTGCEPVSGGPRPGGSAAPSRPGGSAAPRGLPSSMVALGDSITAGYAACVALAPCPRSSWSTGDALGGSHYRRLLDANPAIRGNARNLA